MRNLGGRILSNRLVAEVFASDFEVYLVGGYLRDILRGASSTDADFIFRGRADELRSWLSVNFGRSVIEFRKGPLLRVVTEEGTLDFTEVKGNIEEDLASRDFRMNAAAWSPERGLIDPLGGSHDITKEVVRAVSKDNLINDPLRLLRAYRFSASLGWRIDTSTRRFIRELRALIRKAASERITLELFKVLNSKEPAKTLRAACSDGVLSSFIYCSEKSLQHNVKVLSRCDRFLDEIHDKYYLKSEEVISQGLTFRGLLRAETLLSGANLSKSRLSLSTTIMKRILAVRSAMSLYHQSRTPDRAELFLVFEEVGSSFIDFAICTMNKRILRESVRLLRARQLLTTEEIIHLAGLKKGPKVGAILRELRWMQFSGRIRHADEARRWLIERGKGESVAPKRV